MEESPENSKESSHSAHASGIEWDEPIGCTNCLQFIELSHLYMFGPFVAHHQKVECIYVVNGTCFTSKVDGQRAWTGLPPEDGLQMSPKHVEV
jgi:hypothetical protein